MSFKKRMFPLQYQKALAVHLAILEERECAETFSELMEQISELPAEKRGLQALSLAGHLLELAAFELASDDNSEQIGALIRCAAEISEHFSEADAKLDPRQTARKIVFQ